MRISGDSVVLIEFDAQTMAGRYTALSYCWGAEEELRQRPNLRTTLATYASMTSGIPIQDLPLTLRQAVWVTVCLGQMYIWIDSICIIQDSPSDWAAEALKMATVYATSAVTIIAASSTSCHSGFFSMADNKQDGLGHLLDVGIPPPLTLHATGSSFEHSRGGFHCFPGRDPIDKRGWTFQEEQLSTRYIKFTSTDLQWECRAGTTCLCGAEPAWAYSAQ